MLLGYGRPGDVCGDPLDWIATQSLMWMNDQQTFLRATWTAPAALPSGMIWYCYRDGALIESNCVSPLDLTVLTPGQVPIIGIVPGIPSYATDATYDPSGSRNVANIIDLILTQHFVFGLRGMYRMEDTTLALYELYRGVDAQPELLSTPWQTFTSLPYTTPALPEGHTYNFVLRKRNRFNLCSQNVSVWTVNVAGDGSQHSPPSSPSSVVASQSINGSASVAALYDYAADVDAVRADQWAVWLTSDGTTPNPALTPSYTENMIQSDGMAKLAWTSSAFTNGTTIKVLVRARRSTPSVVDSINTNTQTVIADAVGPTIPVGNEFFGGAAKQG